MKDIKRIIISRTDKIGDLVLSIPSFFMVKKMYPNAEITVLVRKYNYEIVKNLPYIDRVVKIDDYRRVELIEKIKYFKADVFIALYNDEFVMQLAKASGAPIKIGPLSKIKSFFTYNKGVLQKRSKSIKNEAEYNLDLVKKLDPKKFDDLFELNTEICYEEKHKKAVEIFIAEKEIKSPLLVINPFMGGSAKNISDEEYVELIKAVLDKAENINVVLTCHISEEDRGQRILDGIGNQRGYLYANGGDLLNLAAMIDRADVYFGGSTGPTHIAGSLKKSIVAIYPNKKTQAPLRWGVFGHRDVTYIIPDRDKKENYKHKFFDSYTDETREEIVKAITLKLRKD
ncbi:MULTISPECIES: glycosyltransferase family 9 protein [Psychrilyobacter]|uniref:Lipopolysaccharide heptosyltransferase family protein n=1 Tax=Psychrilyobacter piezotolerans TaxID=2293438 RepID=A0ABX9KH66_9FUSO|nr:MULTISPECIES: glycosyltransferase family 9 protein [Psychrilyobacter]MCS5422312.1 glycosyltransferase family 9 protein [Psychrilyobacter sp. S5]NDI77955.1 glycosyltransferase family 9 protein [Psychrilyobacter piezotolerans]RDE62070.1 lipopolysaccharide heptosyltransferase family protein [Psychrilyobacter sp. S5]REI41317.1 lipopolysaccharide heptosyltransferase family protein [Psychrilyobacter piezotolerans]